MDLGTTLRAARERKGLSLEDLAARTKIPSRILHSIERNDFAKVPAGLFARSFIRTYALAVGVDPAASVAEFRAMTEPVVQPVESRRTSIRIRIPRDAVQPAIGSSSLHWSVVVIVAALLISLVVINRNPAEVGSQRNDSQPASGVVTTPREPARTDAASATPTAQRAASIEGIKIEMRAERLCWVRAVVDGEEAFARLMHRGETETVTGRRDVMLRVGDPRALSYWINGRRGEWLGPAEVPVTVRFGPDGIPARVS
jgi:cytoskeleton protein RodZ